MNDNGYVYVLMNPSLPNMVKIGKTTRTPEERAQELSTGTGVPTPFVVVYSNYFESCSDAENFVHTHLSNKGFRVATNREFFEMPTKDAIDAVIKAKEHFGECSADASSVDDSDLSSSSEPPYKELEEIAKNYLYGDNDYIEDTEKAKKYFKDAAKLGSIDALEHLGNIYANIGIIYDEDEKHDFETAIRYYEEHLEKKRSPTAYVSLANIYGIQQKYENTIKIYIKMFKDTRNFTLNTHEGIEFALIPNSAIKPRYALESILENNFILISKNVLKNLHEAFVQFLDRGQSTYVNLLEREEVKANENFLVAVQQELKLLEVFKERYLPLMEKRL